MNPLYEIVSFLVDKEEFDEALNLLRVFEKYAAGPVQYDQLAMCYSLAKDYHQSLAVLTKAGDIPETYQNYAHLYNKTNQPHKSMEYNNKAVAASGDNISLKMERSFSYYALGDIEKSEAIIKELLKDPTLPQDILDRCEFNISNYMMERGEFKRGLLKFVDMGHRLNIWSGKISNSRRWDGKTIPGETLYILNEGGIGDEIITLRFYRNISKLGMKPVIVTSRKDISQILDRMCIENTTTIPEGSLYIQAMYLPIALDLGPDELWSGPYLEPDPDYIEKWIDILPSGTKIGIRWSGNKLYEHDLHRTIPLSELNKSLNFSRDDIHFISLQKEDMDGIEDYPLIDVSEHLETLEDLLACVYLMDYTFSSCTSVVHIAASAGCPITVIPPLATYHVWLGNAKWYGENCKVRRQKGWRDYTHLNGMWSDYE